MKKRALILLLVLFFLFGVTHLAAVRVAEAGAACASGLQAGVAEVTLEHGQGEMVTITYPRAFCRAPVIVVTGYGEVTNVRLGVVTAQVVTLIVDGAPGAARLAWQGAPATK